MQAAPKIDKRIPVPVSGVTTGMVSAMRKLGVGDSFKLPKGLSSSHPHAYGRKIGIKVTVRREGEGHRVWRIA